MANSGVLVRCVCGFPRYYSNWIMKLGVTVVSSSLFVCLFVCLSLLSLFFCFVDPLMQLGVPFPHSFQTQRYWQTGVPNTAQLIVRARLTSALQFSNHGGRARH